MKPLPTKQVDSHCTKPVPIEYAGKWVAWTSDHSYYGAVELQITDENETVMWQTVVGFVEFASSDDEVLVLGHAGCLDHFTATFAGENAELELTPNSPLPSS